jgi:hypothetical protein
MAKSPVDICNLALVSIGQTQLIQDLAEDSEAANIANTVYAQDRDEVLSEFSWPFATRRVRPAPLVASTLTLGEVPGGWGYAFALPADAVTTGLSRIFGVRNPGTDDEVKFVVEQDATLGEPIVLTDVDTPEFVYIMRVEDTTVFPASFTRALAWRIAMDLALGLRKDPKVGLAAEQAYARALGKAIQDAQLSVRPDAEPVPAHIAAR